MKFEEIQELTRRLKSTSALALTTDVRLDSRNMGGEQPEFYYYDVQISVGEEDDSVIVVRFVIDEHPAESEISIRKLDYKFINDNHKQEQQKIYDYCKQIMRDYLNGDLVKDE